MKPFNNDEDDAHPDWMKRMKYMKTDASRLPTGIVLLDDQLAGGVKPGEMSLIMAVGGGVAVGGLASLAPTLWQELSKYSEARYVLEDCPRPYKPFYRLATILTTSDAPHFKIYKIRRHLSEDDAVEVVGLAHEYLARRLEEEGGREHFLHLFNEFKKEQDPATDWIEAVGEFKAVGVPATKAPFPKLED